MVAYLVSGDLATLWMWPWWYFRALENSPSCIYFLNIMLQFLTPNEGLPWSQHHLVVPLQGFLMFPGPSGDSTNPHLQQSNVKEFSLLAFMGWWCSGALMPGFSPTTTCCNFRRCSLGVLSPLCKLIRLNIKKCNVAELSWKCCWYVGPKCQNIEKRHMCHKHKAFYLWVMCPRLVVVTNCEWWLNPRTKSAWCKMSIEVTIISLWVMPASLLCTRLYSISLHQAFLSSVVRLLLKVFISLDSTKNWWISKFWKSW